jgi:hypothetical protein
MLWPERPPDGTKIREMMDTFYRSEPVHIHEHIMGETQSPFARLTVLRAAWLACRSLMTICIVVWVPGRLRALGVCCEMVEKGDAPEATLGTMREVRFVGVSGFPVDGPVIIRENHTWLRSI